MGLEKLIFWIIFIIVSGLVFSQECGEGQKRRVTKDGSLICCHTVVCNKSHTFKYCNSDGGSDLCEECPPGTFTNDPIDTSAFPLHPSDKYQKETDVCAVIPSCAREAILDNHRCVCKLDEGYYGNDPQNCQQDLRNCKNPGYQLNIDGSCTPCPPDRYKPEDGLYRQCREKTVCKEDEVVVTNGSTTTNRQCKEIPPGELSTPKPDILTTPAPVNPGIDQSVTVGLIVGSLVFVIVIVIVIFICRKYWDKFTGIVYRFRRNTNRAPEGVPGTEEGVELLQGNTRLQGHPLTSIRTQPSEANSTLSNGSYPNSNNSHSNNSGQSIFGNGIRNGVHPPQPSGNARPGTNERAVSKPDANTGLDSGQSATDNRTGNGVYAPQQSGNTWPESKDCKPNANTGLDSDNFHELADDSIFSNSGLPTYSTTVGDSIPNPHGNVPSPGLFDSLKTALPDGPNTKGPTTKLEHRSETSPERHNDGPNSVTGIALRLSSQENPEQSEEQDTDPKSVTESNTSQFPDGVSSGPTINLVSPSGASAGASNAVAPPSSPSAANINALQRPDAVRTYTTIKPIFPFRASPGDTDPNTSAGGTNTAGGEGGSIIQNNISEMSATVGTDVANMGPAVIPVSPLGASASGTGATVYPDGTNRGPAVISVSPFGASASGTGAVVAPDARNKGPAVIPVSPLGASVSGTSAAVGPDGTNRGPAVIPVSPVGASASGMGAAVNPIGTSSPEAQQSQSVGTSNGNGQKTNTNTQAARPVCPVTPMVRTNSDQNGGEPSQNQDSNTTDQGQDIQQVSSDMDRDHKVAPSHTRRAELSPLQDPLSSYTDESPSDDAGEELVVDLPPKPGDSIPQDSENADSRGANVDSSLSNEGSIEGMTAVESQNSVQEPVLNVGNGIRTLAGNPVCSPDSAENSQGSSIEQGTSSQHNSNDLSGQEGQGQDPSE